ncbi:MAG: FAD-dependent oxidoreductase [Pseudonocardia sp.]|mgnify:CR=1 FL=1|uniref:NAD(P)/FAD-dependent oxidoreductase n=1 Tax=unclassified Pseudonocardia TaxID=2619320 RepID=UPI00086E9A18|nr:MULTISPECIES: FAD-dependent oxidoreductase [unclassified Pseudonocardia]MBN9109214.1 FAD-dependent oxidoreductase [Pseudonocardia sp.]ODV01503.1 MAG: ferredoxin reductase [Pseudonocardia sp. SCN 73-27]
MQAEQIRHVLVVGAGLGGLRTVEALRSNGYDGRISLVGAEEHLPYDRPPLSKQLLAGTWDADRVTLRAADAYDDLGVRTYLGTRATGWQPGRVELDDGATLHADAIVVATGVVARRLPDQPDGVHTLRTLDDSLALRTALDTASSLVIVGAGFVGAEVAANARDRGIDVTVLEALSVPFARALGEELGGLCARLLVESGARLRTGVGIEGFDDSGGLMLADGDRVAADVTLVGIGGEPRLDWLSDSGIDVTRGLVCDAGGRVEGVDGLWAVGDVAAWWDDVLGRHARREHWTNTVEQAAVVGAAIAGGEPPAASVPYFWSDQFGLKVQLFGRPEPATRHIPLHGDGLDGGPVKGTVVGLLRDDTLVAVAGFGAARRVARYRALVGDGAGIREVEEMAASLA